MEPSTLAILLVDDDPLLLRAMARLLKDRYVVRTANSAEQAQEIIGLARVNVVVSDYDMGHGLDGGQFLAWVETTHPVIRRVLCTGNLKAQTDSAHVVLAKPATFDDLTSAIEGD